MRPHSLQRVNCSKWSFVFGSIRSLSCTMEVGSAAEQIEECAVKEDPDRFHGESPGTRGTASTSARGGLLLFDGACGLCTAWAEWAGRSERGNGYRITPYQEMTDEQLRALGLTRRDCARRLYAVSGNGRVHGGAFAVNAFLWRRPPWRPWIVLLHIVPIFLALEILGYLLVARTRGTLSRWFGYQPRIRRG